MKVKRKVKNAGCMTLMMQNLGSTNAPTPHAILGRTVIETILVPPGVGSSRSPHLDLSLHHTVHNLRTLQQTDSFKSYRRYFTCWAEGYRPIPLKALSKVLVSTWEMVPMAVLRVYRARECCPTTFGNRLEGTWLLISVVNISGLAV